MIIFSYFHQFETSRNIGLWGRDFIDLATFCWKIKHCAIWSFASFRFDRLNNAIEIKFRCNWETRTCTLSTNNLIKWSNDQRTRRVTMICPKVRCDQIFILPHLFYNSQSDIRLNMNWIYAEFKGIPQSKGENIFLYSLLINLRNMIPLLASVQWLCYK